MAGNVSLTLKNVRTNDSERIKKRIEINERLGIYETKYLF